MEILYSLFYIFFSYLLGSFPSGFVITRIFVQKNILEIGWKKASGSNVFKNIGFLPGLLTAIFDVAKGFLAVYFAQKLGFSFLIQAFSGLAAVSGHNWSIFLKFAGGRGIGTFVGALFAFSPQALIFSLFPFLLLAIIWHTSIGTIFFLLTVIVVATLSWPGILAETQYEAIKIFALLSLLPIFLKRLSPIKEIRKNKTSLIKNRLLYDDDVFSSEWRINKIFKKIKDLTKN